MSEATCKYQYDRDYGCYATGCGELFSRWFEIQEGEARYCPFCGKEIEIDE